VSVLLPVYQERDFIRSCLKSIKGFEASPEIELEILVIDGGSSDGTREIVVDEMTADPRIRLLDNPDRFQSAALNLGIQAARGDYIMRLDGHSAYPEDYLALALETALRTGCDNAGGIVKTMSRGNSYQARTVQALITHRFGVGNSGFRTDSPEGPADTVPYGFFRRGVFDRVGLFDERLIRAQDYEMNRRIIAAGGSVWRNPEMEIQYFPQPDLRSFMTKQFALEAPYNAYLWYLAPYAFAPRHAITALFAIGVIGGLALAPFARLTGVVFLAVMSVYFLLALGSAVQQAVRYREPLHALLLPAGFFCYHFLHGLGVLAGLLRLLVRRAPVQRMSEPWPGAGRFRAWPPAVTSRGAAT